MLESKLQAKILRFLKSRECYVVKNILTNTRGNPDIFICYKGYFIFIEVKTPSQTLYHLTPLQKVRICELSKCGARGMVVNDFNDFLEKYMKIKNQIDKREELLLEVMN